MILPGFVKKVMSYGVFVEFSTGIFGLAPNSVSTLAVLRRSLLRDTTQGKTRHRRGLNYYTKHITKPAFC